MFRIAFKHNPIEQPRTPTVGTSVRSRAGGAVSLVLISRTAATVGYQIEHINFR